MKKSLKQVHPEDFDAEALIINMETTKMKRTREEVRAAVRETIRRKKEWIEQTNKEFEMIRNGELKVEDIYKFS